MQYDIIIPVLVFVAVLSIGGAVVSARAERRKTLKSRLSPAPEEPAPAAGGQMVQAVAIFGNLFTLGKASPKLRQDLARAGYHSPAAPSVYAGAKLLLLLGGLAAAYMALAPLNLAPLARGMLTLVVGGLLSFAPNLWLASKRERRSTDIRHHLADAVDLLEVCVTSGMSLDMAWNAVADEIRRVSGTLADEMALANLEVHLGVPRAVAMRHMADRTGAQELSSLVAMLVQTERFGTSIADALRSFAQSMREARSQRAQESAEKTAVKLIVPMVVFIFPAAVIVMAGPAAMQLFKTLGK